MPYTVTKVSGDFPRVGPAIVAAVKVKRTMARKGEGRIHADDGETVYASQRDVRHVERALSLDLGSARQERPRLASDVVKQALGHTVRPGIVGGQ